MDSFLTSHHLSIRKCTQWLCKEGSNVKQSPGDCIQRLSVFIPELITWKSKIKLIFKTPPPQKKKKTKTKQKEQSQKTTATIIF